MVERKSDKFKFRGKGRKGDTSLPFGKNKGGFGSGGEKAAHSV